MLFGFICACQTQTHLFFGSEAESKGLRIEKRHYHYRFFVSGFVGLLTYPFMRRGFSPLRKRIVSAFSPSHDSPSNDRFSPRADFSARKQSFRNTATFRTLPLSEQAGSFRVRDSHPIPLFSEQECVSDFSGRAFATKAMLFSCIYIRA